MFLSFPIGGKNLQSPALFQTSLVYFQDFLAKKLDNNNELWVFQGGLIMSLFKKKPEKAEKSALFMSIGTFISRVLGMVRDMVIGAFFSRTETDAFFVAFRIPNFFRRFIGEGALSISFIPVFIQCLSDSHKDSSEHSALKPTSTKSLSKQPDSATKSLSKQSEHKAKNFMNSVYTLLLLVTAIITATGIVGMEPVFRWLFADTPFAEVESKTEMAVLMARILFVYLFLVTLYAYFMGIANALGKFFIPALAPAFLNIFMIVFSFLPKDTVPYPPLLLCYGVLTGGVLQLILTAGLLFRLGFLPRLSFSFSGPDMKLLLSRFLPGIIGVGGFALIGLLNVYFAGLLPEGAHTYIYYGDRLLELPRSLIAISMGTALLPHLSYFSSQGQKEQMLKISAEQRDLLLFLILPCALAFYFMGVPIIEVLFQRGQFDSVTTENTALVLKIYSFLLVSSSLSRVLATSFYAVKNTWYPALCSGLYVLFHALLAPYMIKMFQLPGLVWTAVISNVFFMCLLGGAYPFFVGKLYVFNTLKQLVWFLPALIGLAFYLQGAFDFLVRFGQKFMSEQIAGILALIFVVLSSIVLYFSLGILCRLPQAKKSLNLMRKKAGHPRA